MEENSTLGLGSELSSIHSSEGALSDPEGDLVGDLLEHVDKVGRTFNQVLQSFQRVEPTSRESRIDTMSDRDSQGGRVDPQPATTQAAAGTQVPSDPPEFVEWQDNDDQIIAPRAGGLMLVEGDPMAYTGSDPDSKVNIYSYVVDQ